jgi:hypothetical protein
LINKSAISVADIFFIFTFAVIDGVLVVEVDSPQPTKNILLRPKNNGIKYLISYPFLLLINLLTY